MHIPNRIHITSIAPRSGTTLLMEMIKFCYTNLAASDHESSLSSSFFYTRTEATHISKEPILDPYVNILLRLDSRLFVVCLIRDPRDIVVSKHGKNPDLYYCNSDIMENFLVRYNGCKSFKNFIEIRYEDLCSNPDDIQDYLESRLPLGSRTHNFSDFATKESEITDDSLAALKGARVINTRSVGGFRRFPQRISYQLSAWPFLAELVTEFDYDISGWDKAYFNEDVEITDVYRNSVQRKYMKRLIGYIYYRLLGLLS